MCEICFIDTMGFIATSLDKLAENKNKNCKSTANRRIALKNLSKYFTNDLQFELVIKKGIYLYKYIDSYDKFYEINWQLFNNFMIN